MNVVYWLFIILFLLLFGVLVLKYLSGSSYQILEQIKEKPENFSLVVKKNGENFISHNADKIMSLASTVKVIVTIAYTRQVEQEMINPTESIPLVELEKYHFPTTDGGAHQEWLDKLVGTDKSVPLESVVRGMIQFSSNANTEYLLERLGIPYINQMLTEFNLSSHDPLFYISPSALLIPQYIEREYPSLNDKESIQLQIESMSIEEYRKTAERIHKLLNSDETVFDIKSVNNSMSLQKCWSDKLPHASANDYANLMSHINRGKGFSEKERNRLYSLLKRDWLLTDRIARIGGKGGSTAFVLTFALYLEDREKNLVEIVFFSNQSDPTVARLVEKSFRNFIKQMIDKPSFSQSCKKALHSSHLG
ncbi:serine hydrolase [Thermoactinomyces sp. DSM 45892]|uniref:serine hydrolase n=1 Tax=Thermoactinomyces sp. DSM 45892 TaxID=1882753 RepID=UPI000895428C|nr:serine hydrolase [Thermoactinomyces sp. DSM 45892]SDZ05915.1 D-alanyl-D-alanine carboxypeptidase [Thermoactinomyces sp. DSM 45892]